MRALGWPGCMWVGASLDNESKSPYGVSVDRSTEAWRVSYDVPCMLVQVSLV